MAYVKADDVNFGDEATSSRIQRMIDNQEDHESRIGDLDSFNNVWWEELGRTTLGSSGDTITVSGLTAKKYLYVVVSVIPSGGTINAQVRFNNDSGSNYAQAGDETGGKTSFVSQTSLTCCVTSNAKQYGGIDIDNIATEAKFIRSSFTTRGTAGAGTAPNWRTVFGKWENTANAITRIDVINPGTGDFASGSEVVVLGHD